MTDFQALSYAMSLCTERESGLRAAQLEGADEAKAVRSHLRQMRQELHCQWTEDSDGQLHAHGQIWNPGAYLFCPTCGLPTSISKQPDL